MPTAYVDRTDTLQASERDGVVTKVVRRARVVGLTDDDYAVLFTALSVAGVPAAGSTLTGAPNLVLVERNVQVVDGDRSTVDVELVYEHVLNKGQNLNSPPLGYLLAEVRGSVNEQESNLDGSGFPVTVQHAYPSDDPDFPSKTKVQGGSIKFFQAQATKVVQGIRATNYPWLLQQHLLGAINELPWSGGNSYEWLCTGASWRPYDGSSSKYEFVFEFQHNPETWNPTVVYIDERTGKPPQGLLDNVGYKTVVKHRVVDFAAALGGRVQGE